MWLTKRTVQLTSASLVVLALSLQVKSQQQHSWGAELEAIERETTTLLLKEDLNKVIARLPDERPTTVAPILRQLSLYARAGRPNGGRRILEQLEAAADWESAQKWPDVRWRVMGSLGEDLDAWRYYYERLSPQYSDGAETFLQLWDRKGDPKELDSWLALRSNGEDEWFRQRLLRRAELGTAAELLEPLAVAIRANPQDFERVRRYLRANNYARNVHDVSWLVDTCKLTGPYEHYELAWMLSYASPAATARLLEKSLTLPFAERDDKLVESALSRVSMLQLTINHEKQLRFWTKQLLAKAYQDLKRPLDAQPLIEQLVTMKGTDILEEDVHALAGAVQSQSGQRVVETKILRDEATRRQTAAYWLERGSYYEGRSEYKLEAEAYVKGLAVLSDSPDNDKTKGERLELVRSFAIFVEDHADEPQWRPQLERVLRTEFKNAHPESNYAFWIAQVMTGHHLELKKLCHDLLASQPSLVARMLARREWGTSERGLIEDIAGGDEVSPEERAALWNALEKLVTEPGSARASYLAEAMSEAGSWDRALPLWISYLKNSTPSEYDNRYEIRSDVIKGYCRMSNWKAAEEFLFSNTGVSWRSLPSDLGRIAACAAQQGATSDAVRLWRLKANLNRWDLTGLDLLARTEAKAQLRDFYLQMKKDDPQTIATEAALRWLQ